MMNTKVSELVRDGYKIVGRGPSAVYLERGADSRVVLNSGTIKRGKPEHRADQVNPK